MRNLLAQVGHCVEAHVEKMVLGLAGLVCLYLLVTQVILGPDRVPYLNHSYSPGSIDDHVRRKADDVAAALAEVDAARRAADQVKSAAAEKAFRPSMKPM